MVSYKSVEGGNPTVAYGHKITDEELEQEHMTMVLPKKKP